MSRVAFALLLITACSWDRLPEIVDDASMLEPPMLEPPIVEPCDGDACPPPDGPPPPTVCDGPCALNAIDRPIAKIGETIYLEGTFAHPMTVTFPGNAVAMATVLGAHRASVVVPAGATIGTLSITTMGMTIGAISFHATSWKPTIGTFAQSYPQTDIAKPLPSLARARYTLATVTHNGWVYAIGGAPYTNTIEKAQLFPDDRLGTWSSSENMIESRASPAAVVIGDYLYVIGGDTPARLASIERAKFDSAGGIGAFQMMTTTLPTTSTALEAIVIGDSIYTVGGLGPSAELDTLVRIPVKADATLGTATVAGHLVHPESGFGLAVVGRYLYVVGHWVERVPINADGSLGVSEEVAGLVVARRPWHGVARLGDGLYVIGGEYPGGGVDNTVERAQINADDTLGPFTKVGDLSTKRWAMGVAIGPRSIYLVAGGSQITETSLDRAPLDGDATLGAFAATATPLTSRNHGLGIVASATRLHVLAGRNDTAQFDSQSAAVNPDSTISTFAGAGVPLVARRDNHAQVVIGRATYLIGGLSGTTFLASIERSSLNNDGSLGAFATQTSTLITARACAAAVVVGNQLYVVGGRTAMGTLASVERATINSDGTLGTFATVSGVTLQLGRATHAIYSDGKYVYVIGGDTALGNAPTASIERAAITGSTLGTFTTYSSLATARMLPAVAAIGSALYVLGGRNTAGNLDTIERALLSPSGPGTFATITAKLARGRASPPATIVNDAIYLLGGDDATGVTATVERAPL